MIMPFNWLKKQKKEPLSCSRSPIKIFSTPLTETPKSVNGNIREAESHPQVQLKQPNGNDVPGREFEQSQEGQFCGFATGEQNNVKQSSNNAWATEELNTLFARLNADELFRVRVLTANSIEEQMEILEAKNINCSSDELQKALDRCTKEKTIDTFANRSLWGNRIS
jgi:hypothetical protein